MINRKIYNREKRLNSNRFLMIILLKFTNDKSNIKVIYCHFYAHLRRKGEEKSCFFTIKIMK